MKNIKRSHLILFIAIGSMMALSSCKKKDDTPLTPSNGTLLFHLHTYANGNEIDNYGDTMTISGGRRLVVTKAQSYISGIQLIKTDGSAIDGPAVNILHVQQEEEYTGGSAAAGNYESVKFNAGVSASTNSAAPSSSDPALYRKDMWFDSTNFVSGGGFVFVDFEGLIDTATTPSVSNPLTKFVFRIGTNANLKTITMPNQNYTIMANQATELHIVTDYARLFDGLQLNQSSGLIMQTAADNNSWSWAVQVANNIPGMFYYE